MNRPLFSSVRILLMALLVIVGATTATIIASLSSTPVELLTVNLPKEIGVGKPLKISGVVRDPANPNGTFGLPGVNVTVQITTPDFSVSVLSTSTTMSGTWQVFYTAAVAGVYIVRVEVAVVHRTVTTEFKAV